MKLYTFEEMYDRKAEKGYGEPELRAYDEARYQLTDVMLKRGINPDIEECPEDCIFDFVKENGNKFRFDENGNLIY